MIFFFDDFWAVWYIKTVYFSHEIKLDNADLIFKHFIFFFICQLFCIFLKYFSYPCVSGKVLWVHVCQSISLSVHLSVCKPFFLGITHHTFLIFCVVTVTHEYKRKAEPDLFLKKYSVCASKYMIISGSPVKNYKY